MNEPTVIHIQPDDTILITNITEPLTTEFIDQLRAAIPTARDVFAFTDDIHVQVCCDCHIRKDS